MSFTLFYLFTVFSALIFAQTEVPQFMTVDGKLYDAGGNSEALLDGAVQLRMQVLNPAKTCILYEEQQVVSTLSTGGYFNVQLGSDSSGGSSGKRTSNDSGNSMREVFQNKAVSITGKTSGGSGCSYTPSGGESRYIRFIVTPSTTGVVSTLSPDLTVDAVAQSWVSESLQGLGPSDFIQVNSDVTQAKLDGLFGSDYTGLTSLLTGTSGLYLQSTSNGTTIPSRPTDPSSPTAGQIWYDSTTNELKYYNGTVVQALSAGGASDPTKLPLVGGTMSGAINMGSNDITGLGHMVQAAQRTLRLGGYSGAQESTLIGTPLTGGQEGTLWYNTSTDRVMYWDGSGAQEVLTSSSANGLVPNCAADESLQMSVGPVYVWSCVATTDSTKLALTGGSLSGAVTMTAQNQVRFADSAGGEYVALQAPATIGTNYVLTLPDSAGSSGQVLQTDGAGVLSWVAIPSAPVTSVFGRTGVVVAATSDYDANQIDNTPAGTIAATDVQGALNELDSEKVPTARTLTTAANSGLSGGGDLSANRTFVVDITGTTAETVVAGGDEILIYDVSASALRKMTRTNFVLSETEVDAMVSNNGYLTAETDTLATVTGRGATTSTNVTLDAQAQLRYADAAGGEYVAIQAPATVASNVTLTLPATAGTNGQYLQTDGSGVLSWVTPAGVGETNTASNVGVGGVGVYKQKTTYDLEFRSINAASNKVSVALDAGNNEIDINVNEANFDPAVIPNTAAGNMAATNVQSAINELDSEKVAKIGDAMTGALTMNAQNQVRFADSAGGEYAAIQAPATIGSNYTLTLPVDDGITGQVLQTDGSGVLSWVDMFVGDITDVVAGSGLAGGGSSGSVTLNVGAGTGIIVNANDIAVDVGTSVGQVVQVQTGGKLPALDGSDLTNLDAGDISAGTLAVGRGGTGQTSYTDGQLLIGNSTGNTLTKGTLTAGSGVSVTNGAGSITVASTLGTSVDLTSEVTGTLPIGNGGTGQTTANGALNALLPSQSGQSGKYLSTDGTNTSWSSIAATALSGLTAATATNTIANANYAQVWNWDTLTTQTAMGIGSSSMTTGTLLDLTSSYNNASSTGKVLKLSVTGTSNAAVPLMVTNAGTGLSLRVNDNGTDTDSSPFVIDAAGNMGVGTASPAYKLDVNGSVRADDFCFNTNCSSPIISEGWGVRLNGSSTNPTQVTSSSLLVGYTASGSSYGTGNLYVSGNIGVGTTSPRAALDVTGAIVSKAALSVSTTTVDFAANNLAYTSQNCQAYVLHNMKDGASYTFAVQGTTSATCSFTAYSGSGTGALTVKMPPGHTVTIGGNQTVYSFMVMGSTVYVAWVPGY